jgi:hypothetical protein
MGQAAHNDVQRALFHKIGAERGPILVAASVGQFIGAGAQGGDWVVLVWHPAANARTEGAFPTGGRMARAKKSTKRRRRTSLAQVLREMGPRLRTAYRHTRVALWRFKRSPAQRDGAAAIATFAFIGLFALGSVDAVITGGADFGPSAAYANEYRSAQVVTVQAAPVAAAIAEEPQPAVKTLPAETIDYSVTAEVLLGGPEVVIDEEAIVIDASLLELSPTL